MLPHYKYKNLLVLGGTGSVVGVRFQKIYGLHSVNHQIIEYWVSRGRYWLVLSSTGSEQGGTGCQYDMLSENILFAWSKSSNY